ncbi:MAG: MFS transporter [Deltaproteobacteria bacterium]|nr:MFS transporter [Deltaproteobacteria bacterium]
MTEKSANPPRAAFRHRSFRLYIVSRFIAFIGQQMLLIAIAQSVYEMTHNPMYLGYIGLSLFIPKFAFILFAGHMADQFDRRSILLASRFIQLLMMFGLILYTWSPLHPLWILYGLLFILGFGSAVGAPASQAMVTQLVPTEQFSNAVIWNSSSFQLAFILGPVLGGWLYTAFGRALPVYWIAAALHLVSTLLIFCLPPLVDHIQKTEISKSFMAGIHYVLHRKIILGVISMDLFAVLLGGAVALLPIYANDILKVGASGLGLLRAAPSLGAGIVAVSLAYLPPFKRAGSTMLWCVALFGLATIGFGLSKNFIFSILCLVTLGAADMVSVMIRGVLVQVQTPPAMRGRVSAVNMIFIGASNELGEFESGLTASWFGVIPSVVVGGLGTLTVVALWSWLFPEIRSHGRLDESYEKKVLSLD